MASHEPMLQEEPHPRQPGAQRTSSSSTSLNSRLATLCASSSSLGRSGRNSFRPSSRLRLRLAAGAGGAAYTSSTVSTAGSDACFTYRSSGFHALTDMSPRGLRAPGPAASAAAPRAPEAVGVREAAAAEGLYPALRTAARTSLRSSFSSTPAALSLNSVNSASAAGVLYCLYLMPEFIERPYPEEMCAADTLPATAIALDGGTLLLVRSFRKFGSGIFTSDNSFMLVYYITYLSMNLP